MPYGSLFLLADYGASLYMFNPVWIRFITNLFEFICNFYNYIWNIYKL